MIFNHIDDNRVFETTTFEKKEGVELNLHKIRKYLNMLTENTLDTIKEDIFNEINSVLLYKTQNDFNYICKEIYKLLNRSVLYSNIYAKLYTILIVKFPIFEELLINEFDNYQLILNNINYCKPDVDYDKFCENNKKNQEVIGIITFYVNLFKINIIDKNKFYSIITNLFNILDDMILSNDKKNEMDIISELIFVLITNCYKKINENDIAFGKRIYDNIKRIATIKKKIV